MKAHPDSSFCASSKALIKPPDFCCLQGCLTAKQNAPSSIFPEKVFCVPLGDGHSPVPSRLALLPVTSSWSNICCLSFSMSWLCWLISSSCRRQGDKTE